MAWNKKVPRRYNLKYFKYFLSIIIVQYILLAQGCANYVIKAKEYSAMYSELKGHHELEYYITISFPIGMEKKWNTQNIWSTWWLFSALF